MYVNAKEWLLECEELKKTVDYCNMVINNKWLEETEKIVSNAESEKNNAIKNLNNKFKIVDGLDCKEEKTILMLRYFDGLSWENIQNWFYDNNYPLSERQIFYIHKSGLKKVQDKINKT